jgi:ABC-type lipoprotein release transport system permease subunit
MLFSISWRNIWRSRLRSFVVVGSIILGIWAIIFGTGFMNGFMVGYMADAINHDISNIQVHHPDFKADQDIRYTIPEGKTKAAEVREWSGVKGVTTRSLVNGMISSPRKAGGVQIRGINLKNEAIVTRLDSLIDKGTYFEGIRRNPVVIGRKLAENLQVDVKSKVVLTFNDAQGNITAGAFRIAGIIESSSLSLGEGYAFVVQEDLNRLLGLEGAVHEIAILLEDQVEEATIVSKYNKIFPEDLVETWKEIAPQLAFLQEMYGNMLYVLMGIILIALIFGIVNTMLMAVLERMKELGMLMAIGMTKIRVFLMIIIETIYLGAIGSPLGLLAGWLTIRYYNHTGVDLTAYSEGLEAFGYQSILYPYVEGSVYMTVTIGIFATAFLGAIYPAIKAIKLKPAEALHKI